ncbi:MAG: peptide deformylase [Vicinamibacterales bacterium]|jgi:peptide deformylase|nr:peptide deformylase [Vicinamibacterales bacterium]
MIRPILRYGADALHSTAKPVDDFGVELQTLIDDMIETMYAAPGVGLAAPQVGVALRLFVVDSSSGQSTSDLHVLANPEVVEQVGSQSEEEGCLSLPGFTARVVRPTRVVLKGLDRDGTPIQLEGEGLEARVFQHELDHLDGSLFVNRLHGIRRDQIVRRVRKLQRTGKW